MFKSFLITVLFSLISNAAPLFHDGQLVIQPDGKFEIGYPWKETAQEPATNANRTLKFSTSNSFPDGPTALLEAGIKDNKVKYILHASESAFANEGARAKTVILYMQNGFIDCRMNPRNPVQTDKSGKLTLRAPNNKRNTMATRCTYVSLADCRKFAPKASVPTEEGLIDLSDEFTKARKPKQKPPTEEAELLKKAAGLAAKDFNGLVEDIEHDSFSMLEAMPLRCLVLEQFAGNTTAALTVAPTTAAAAATGQAASK